MTLGKAQPGYIEIRKDIDTGKAKVTNSGITRYDTSLC